MQYPRTAGKLTFVPALGFVCRYVDPCHIPKGRYEIGFRPKYTGIFQLEIDKAIPGVLTEYYYGAAVHNNAPTTADERKIDNFAGERFSLVWDIEDAPAFMRFSGLIHFDKCRLKDWMNDLQDGTGPQGPPALAVWVTQNTTVEILFWNEGDVASKNKERVKQVIEYVATGQEQSFTPQENLDLSLLKKDSLPCQQANLDQVGFYCITDILRQSWQ